MNMIDWLFILTGILLVAYVAVAGYIVVTDRRERRAWELEDARTEWREFVDAMRRLEEQDRDVAGDA